MPEIPEEAIRAAAEALGAHPWNSYPHAAHREHTFDSACMVCRADLEPIARVAVEAAVDALAGAGLVVVSAEDLGDGDPALAEVERLARELYKARDALSFARECCDIADRNSKPVTTALVREWLDGVKCGRRLLAEQATRDQLRAALAHWLRTWADRIDDDGAPKRAAGLSFTFEAGKGIVVREDGKGCPLYYISKTDYERAHHEADSYDPIKEEVMRLLDPVDSGGDLPPGWTLGGTAGRDGGRG